MVPRIRRYSATLAATRCRTAVLHSGIRPEMPNCPFIGTRSMKSHQPGGLVESTTPLSASPTIQWLQTSGANCTVQP